MADGVLNTLQSFGRDCLSFQTPGSSVEARNPPYAISLFFISAVRSVRKSPNSFTVLPQLLSS